MITEWTFLEEIFLIPTTEQTFFLFEKISIMRSTLNGLSLFQKKILRQFPHHLRTTSTYKYVTHIISQGAKELWPTRHRVIVQSFHPHSNNFLFARFAWTVLQLAKRLILKGRQRVVIRNVQQADGKKEYKESFYIGKFLERDYGGGANPKKRKSGQDSVNDSEDTCSDSSIVRKGRRESSGESAPDFEPHLAPDVEAHLRKALHEGIRDKGQSRRKTFALNRTRL